tara:strand:- start:23 stop:1555 length:1533 start_codon:yes stop_codon:yes gene_type:complete
MSPRQHEQVEPTPFDAARPAAKANAPQARRTSWIIPTFAGLLALAVLVIFWLPGKVAPPGPAEAAPETQLAGSAGSRPAAPAAKPTATAASGDATPWTDAQQAKLRREAQDVLETLLDTQFRLEESGVMQWAPESFSAARSQATLADEHYRSRDFPAATAGYREALAALQALENRIPDVLADLLERTHAALEASDTATAAGLLDTIARLAPDHPELAALRTRLEVAPKLIPLLEEAATLEETGDLAAAELRLRQASKLDPQHQGAAQALARVAAALETQRFNTAMSEGYAALDTGQYSDAKAAFRRADRLRPDAGEAASALAEVASAETAAELASLRRVGRQYEDRERWQAALEAYQRALQTDGSLLFAQEGLARVGPRAELDQQLRAVIQKPERLSDATVAADSAKLLAQATRLSPAGPLLQEQISTLEQLLERANTPVEVRLRSDGETVVTVLKVARLGRFHEQRLQLRPGSYTATGTRLGYRDVRLQFEVSYERKAAPVTIACTEAI